MLAGYSFGAAIANVAADEIAPAGLILVSPPPMSPAGPRVYAGPVLAITGDQDPIAPPRALDAVTPNGTRTVVAGVDHGWWPGLDELSRAVAEFLNESGLATLLIDLLVADEDADDGGPRHPKWDIELLSTRLVQAREWTAAQPELTALPVGYFGASTGAAAALCATAVPDADIAAVVSRGGRPDLAAPYLAAVRAPTLLIVGGHDEIVLELNRRAQSMLRCPNRLAVV